MSDARYAPLEGAAESALPSGSSVVRELLQLALPMFVSSACFAGMKTTDTALLGHAGTTFLSAAAASDLFTQSTGVLIQGRVLGFFCGQAIGAGNPQVKGQVDFMFSLSSDACHG